MQYTQTLCGMQKTEKGNCKTIITINEFYPTPDFCTGTSSESVSLLFNKRGIKDILAFRHQYLIQKKDISTMRLQVVSVVYSGKFLSPNILLFSGISKSGAVQPRSNSRGMPESGYE